MILEFLYTKRADKFFNKHIGVKEDFENSMIRFLKGDRNINIKMIQGFKTPLYRMRLGNYRVIFTRQGEDIVIVQVVDAGSRGDIYNHLKDIKKTIK